MQDSIEAGRDSMAPAGGFSSIEGYTTPGPLKACATRALSPTMVTSPTGAMAKGSTFMLKTIKASSGKGPTVSSLKPVLEHGALDSVSEGPQGTVEDTPGSQANERVPPEAPLSKSLHQGVSSLAVPFQPSPLGPAKAMAFKTSSTFQRPWDAPSPTSTPLKLLANRYYCLSHVMLHLHCFLP